MDRRYYCSLTTKADYEKTTHYHRNDCNDHGMGTGTESAIQRQAMQVNGYLSAACGDLPSLWGRAGASPRPNPATIRRANCYDMFPVRKRRIGNGNNLCNVFK